MNTFLRNNIYCTDRKEILKMTQNRKASALIYAMSHCMTKLYAFQNTFGGLSCSIPLKILLRIECASLQTNTCCASDLHGITGTDLGVLSKFLLQTL